MRTRIGRLSQEKRLRRGEWPIVARTVVLVAAIGAYSTIGVAAEEPKVDAAGNSSLYVKVQLNKPLKLSKLKPGGMIEGSLARDVYSADRELFPAGSHVSLPVDHMEKRRRARNDHWPWVVNFFTPRHEQFPVFTTGFVSGTNGQSPLQVSLISINRKREVHAQAKKEGHAGQKHAENGSVEVTRSGKENKSGNLAAPVMVLEGRDIEDQNSISRSDAEAVLSPPDLAALETLPSGTACKILLLEDISASKSHPGDTVRARLLEPVLQNSRVVIPAGSLFEGRVVKKNPPRWGSRAGSLFLTFTSLTLPGENRIPIAASLAGAELDRSSHTRIDAEGQLRGERPGKAWMAINIGVTAGLAKEVDDTTQLIIEAIVSSATDASTAGTSRIVSTCISAIFMVTRHGRDVVLPRFTEMDIALDRPLSITPKPGPNPEAAGAVHN